MTTAEDVYNDLLDQHGGLAAFSTVQLQLARSIVKMMASLQVVQIADVGKVAAISAAMQKLLEQLPPRVLKPTHEGKFSERLKGMSVIELAKLYERVVADPDSPEFALDEEENSEFDVALDSALDDIISDRLDPTVPDPPPADASHASEPLYGMEGASPPQNVSTASPERSKPIIDAERIDTLDRFAPPPPSTCSSPAERDHRLKVFSFLHLKDDDPRRQL